MHTRCCHRYWHSSLCFPKAMMQNRVPISELVVKLRCCIYDNMIRAGSCRSRSSNRTQKNKMRSTIKIRTSNMTTECSNFPLPVSMSPPLICLSFSNQIRFASDRFVVSLDFILAIYRFSLLRCAAFCFILIERSRIAWTQNKKCVCVSRVFSIFNLHVGQQHNRTNVYINKFVSQTTRTM